MKNTASNLKYIFRPALYVLILLLPASCRTDGNSAARNSFARYGAVGGLSVGPGKNSKLPNIENKIYHSVRAWPGRYEFDLTDGKKLVNYWQPEDCWDYGTCDWNSGSPTIMMICHHHSKGETWLST